MKREDVLALPSMPAASPSYPRGPYRFIDREYLIITYETDADALRDALPEPLQPDGSNTALFEFIRMPDSSGFGDYTESGVVIPARLGDEHVNFTAQMYLDDEPPIAGGREIWGFPKKHARPRLSVVQDTLTGTLEYASVQVAVGTMGYKHQHLLYDVEGRRACSPASIIDKMSTTQVNLKIIPGVDGAPAIAQLVGYNLADIRVKGAWSGPARLGLVPHVNAPVADLPVKRVFGAVHFIADITLPYGLVLHDYMEVVPRSEAAA
ncbi:acetoacetate decarboxylase [Paraburkholderia sp. CNPSo 3157]|uniref:Acetoacetate decarboxylase n=1 Tax=Paraburkholderia franconis TaxID=2654983 RepID=A0A7X1NK21_9BURK|nr:acetoacetate decarboxylase [Paraburkholderia franconis]MPW23410.1 acetoacetate decarboxylase [Paraburkholderia franconis]